jgi:indoleamine 2,3-dioxygenase
MMWDITDRGFLGIQDPLRNLTAQNEKYVPLVARLENISCMLGTWIEQRRLREELVSNLRDVSHLLDEDFLDTLDEFSAERVMLLFSYMASAYVYARYELPATRIPCEIAIPLVKIAEKVGRKPILSYASYCLTNWERKVGGDLNVNPICLDNINLMTNFCTPEVGKQDEDWFILIHVEIESNAAPGVAACKTLLAEAAQPWGLKEQMAAHILTEIHRSLIGMNATLARMPEQCSPDNYFRWVRPYIFSFKDMVYEGCFNNAPQTFRGETGAQSTIIPIFLAALGVRHKDSMLTQHLEEMREYMPKPHREFLQNLLIQQDENAVPIVSLRRHAKNGRLREIYNDCIAQIVQFREKHFEYAVNYIYNKVESPEGTGGTPYVPWLKQLKEETEEHILS